MSTDRHARATVIRWGALALGLWVVGFAAAPPRASAQPGPGHHRKGPPPPAAFEACKGKKADEACQVTFGQHERTGKCAATPDGALACRAGRPMGPPPEQVEACKGRKAGDPCTAQLGQRTVAGECRSGRGDQLACRPPRHD